MMFKKKTLILFVFILIFFTGLAQDKIVVDSLLKEQEKTNNNFQKVDLLIQLAWEYVDYNQEKGIYYAQKATALAQKFNYEAGEASAYNVMALCFELKGNLDTAFVLYNQSYKKRVKLKDYQGASGVLLNIGAAYFLQGYYNLALKNYLNSIYLLKENNLISNNSLTLSKVYNNIGLIHRTKKEYEEAIKWYLQSLQIKKEIKDTRGVLNSFINLSMTYQNLKDYKKALSYVDSAIVIAKNEKWEEEYASLYTNKASIQLNQGKIKTATENITKAFEWLEKILDAKTKTYTFYTAGEIDISEKKYILAIDNFLKCIDLAKKQNNREVLQSAYAQLAQCYAFNNAYKDAYSANLKHQEIRDSIFNLESKRSLDEQQILFNVKENEQKITHLNIENNKKELERKQAEKRFVLSIIFSTLFGIGILILIFLWKKNREKNKALNHKNLIIETALQEKETLLKEIHHRVKNNLQIIIGLLELQESLHEDQKIEKLISEAHARIKTMAIIHEMLYQNNDLNKINVLHYVNKLISYIESEFKKDEISVEKNITINKVFFNIDTIVPLGLILNELLTNIFKYAFVSKSKKQINVSITLIEQKKWQLKVSDNGVGIHDYESKLKQGSFGLKLVTMLARQLKGGVEYYCKDGSFFLINFEEQKI
ncbi:MAG: tetratricopeptide repeat protein [Chitinophagales bacterium]|nr:tetratricopeptide repeat protein [Chitinophagales bacterium]